MTQTVITEVITQDPDAAMDAAILAALTESGGRVMPWADVRDQLPPSNYWHRVQSLVRLQQSGQVDVVKVGGCNFVALPMTIGRRRAA